MKQFVWAFLYALLIINVGIFIFLLIKKLMKKTLSRKKAKIRKSYEEDFLQYITHQDSELKIVPKTYLEKKVLQSLILDYNSFISGENQTILLEKIGKDSIVHKVYRYLNSSNVWQQKTGTYLAGEYELGRMLPLLLKQLQTSDNELLFVTARSLIKIADRAYLKEILEEAAKERRMSKRNVLSLLELVEGNIKDILESIMLTDNTFLKIIALEEYGKRQYKGCIKWIKKLSTEPQKELRIAALKAGYELGEIDDDSYLSHMMSMENDTEWEVRAFLAKFLRKVNGDVSIGLLSKLIADENWYVRLNAGESLLAHNEPGQIALLNLLDSKDPFARDTAEAVLQREALHYE